ncbi:MAG: DUF4293 family protein [Bacteroidetes bacterium]|nr:DUF4293 family protein [Bacteroidota bacterium]
MIQRKQTLFLIELIFLGLSFLFVPCQTILTKTSATNIYLMPLVDFQSTTGHLAAIILNFIGLVLATFTIFSFKKRELQVKLCYAQLVLWLIIIAMILFCPFVVRIESILEIQVHYFVIAIGLFAVIAAYLAAHFIKKDIELLKSADRIR